jgi:hypothetical protein
MKASPQFEATIAAIDHINKQDPNTISFDGKSMPKELLYAQRMTTQLNEYDPEASETLHIAARGQHIKRWEIPRSDYSMDRQGYLKWRTQLKIMHAGLVEQIMSDNQYDQAAIQEVRQLIMKNKLKTDPKSKELEDVVCLVFLAFYFDDFMAKHEEEKVISIVQKTWAKMTDKGHEMALKLNFTDASAVIIKKALA